MAFGIENLYIKMVTNQLKRQQQRMKESLQNNQNAQALDQSPYVVTSSGEPISVPGESTTVPGWTATVVRGNTLHTNINTPGTGVYVDPWGRDIGTAPQWESEQPSKKATSSEIDDEVRLREKSIEHTIKMFGSSDVPLEEFCNVLEGVHNFIRYGVPLKVKTKQTINE